MSSLMHKRVIKFDRDDIMSENDYEPWLAYGRSKLANVLFAYALSKRLKDKNITVNCCHPGVVATQLLQ